MAQDEPRHPGEIDIQDIAELDDAREFLRMWNSDHGPICIVRPRHLQPDPFAFGMAVVDAIRHAARAWSQAVDISEDDALARIYEGFDAERGQATTGIRQVHGEPH